MRTLSVVCGLVLLVTADPGLSQSKDDPGAIVDRAIKAQGTEKLAKAKAHTWKVKGKLTMAENEMAYTADYLFAAPDKFRFDLDMEMGGEKMKISAASDGKVAWEKAQDMLREMEKQKQTEFQHNVYVHYLAQLTPLKDKAFTLTPLGESIHGDQTLVGIKAAHPGKRDVSLYFDTKTGLLTKTSTRVHDEFQDKEVTQDVFITGYRDKDGRKEFEKVTIHRDGKEFIVEEISGYKMLEKVDPKQFAKPAADK